jgi:hypothetical protein
VSVKIHARSPVLVRSNCSMTERIRETVPVQRTGQERVRRRIEHVNMFPVLKSHTDLGRWCEKNEQESTWRTRGSSGTGSRIRLCAVFPRIPFPSIRNHVFTYSLPVPERSVKNSVSNTPYVTSGNIHGNDVAPGCPFIGYHWDPHMRGFQPFLFGLNAVYYLHKVYPTLRR